MADARARQPEECCGVLLGAGDRIADAHPARNVAERPTARFVVDPRDHFAAIRDGRERGLTVVGFYHSHPRSPAWPSPSDVAEASYPGHLYLIVSLTAKPPDIAIYRLDDHGGNFLRLPVVTVG